MRRLITVAGVALMTFLASPGFAGARTFTESFASLSRVSGRQAIGFLDVQRQANGLGSLVFSPSLATTCRRFVNYAWRRKLSNATPPSAPQAWSAEAGGAPGYWNGTVNPWGEDPDTLAMLFDPLATIGGYAETMGQWGLGDTCLEMGGQLRKVSAPSFFSVPGPGADSVPAWVTPGSTEGEGDPQKFFGLPGGRATGPNIVLWAEGGAADLASARLLGPTGRVALVTVREGMVPGESSLYYAVPPHPLRPKSPYTLTADWQEPDGSQDPQTVNFRTGTHAAADGAFVCADCARGRLTATISGPRVSVTMTPAANQMITAIASRGIAACLISRSPCPIAARKFWITAITVRRARLVHGRAMIDFPLGDTAPVSSIAVQSARFTALGYQWEAPDPISTYQGASWRHCVKTQQPDVDYPCHA